MITLKRTNKGELREATGRRSPNIYDPNQLLKMEFDRYRKLQGPHPIFAAHMQALHIAVQIGLPTLIWGPPGVGKTAHIQAMATALKLHLEVVLASIREPSDFSGLPVIHEGMVNMAPPQWAQRLIKAGKGLLFLDEISTAPPAVQAALLRVILDRAVGDVTLPDGIAIVAAANPPEEAAGGWELSPPLANRFVHLQWTTYASQWIAGFLAGWPTPTIQRVPRDWESHIPEIKAVVTAFIRRRPNLLLAIPESEAEAGKAWPSPRTWEYATKALAAAKACGADREIELDLLSGCVGEAVAIEFHAFLAELDLPDPEEILANAETFKLADYGDRGDIHFAILGSVVAAFIGNPSQERYIQAWEVMAAAAQQDAADLALPSVKLLTKEGHAQAYKGDIALMTSWHDALPLAPLLKT